MVVVVVVVVVPVVVVVVVPSSVTLIMRLPSTNSAFSILVLLVPAQVSSLPSLLFIFSVSKETGNS